MCCSEFSLQRFHHPHRLGMLKKVPSHGSCEDCLITPWKINMKPNHWGLVQIIFLSKWVICRFQPLIFQGVKLISSSLQGLGNLDLRFKGHDAGPVLKVNLKHMDSQPGGATAMNAHEIPIRKKKSPKKQIRYFHQLWGMVIRPSIGNTKIMSI